MSTLNEKLEYALNAFFEAKKKEEEKLDPVGKEDDDVDNDGDSDDTDAYLKKKRAAIAKTLNKDKLKEMAKASKN